MKITRIAMIACAGAAALALAACGGNEVSGWDAQSVSQSTEGVPFQPQLVNSNLGVGQNRIAVALFNEEGGLVSDAEIEVRLYRLAADPQSEPAVAEAAGEVTLTPRTLDINPEHASRFDPPAADDAQRAASTLPAFTDAEQRVAHEGDLTTVFVANVEFDRSGWWGFAINATVEGTEYRDLLLRTFVQEHTSEPAIGDPAPPSRQATLADAEITDISSAENPIAGMLEMTVADALQTGKPVVVAFVTPAFCQTRFCGPVLEQIVVPAYEQYNDRAIFIHVEPYVLAKARTEGVLEPVPAVTEWGLRSEPIIFVIGTDGRIVAKFEGILEVTELTEAIEAALK